MPVVPLITMLPATLVGTWLASSPLAKKVYVPVRFVAVATAVMVTDAVAVVAGAAVAAAMIDTGPAVRGAVYTVVPPLAVWIGLKVPQVPTGVQLQSTPAAVRPPVAVAAIVAD